MTDLATDSSSVLPACGGHPRVEVVRHCVLSPPSPLRTVEVGGIRARRIAVAPAFARRNRLGESDDVREDVALVELATPVTDVRPLPLGVGALGGADAIGRAAGTVLRRTTIRVAADPACATAFAHSDGVLELDGQLCTRDADQCAPFTGPCFGDSGGPILQGGAVVGIVSYGDICALGHGLHTDVAAYRAFITSPDPVWAPRAAGAPASSERRRRDTA